MAVNIDWLVEKRVIKAQLSGTLSIRDIQALNEGLSEHLKQGTEPVFIIVDDSQVVGAESMSLPKFEGLTSLFLANKKLKRIAVFGSTVSRLQFLRGLVTKFAHVEYGNYKTREEAVAFIKDADPSLPDLDALL